MKKVYKMRKTISMKQLLTEMGGDFSKRMKQRLLELGERCVLTRKDESFIFDIKHVEHTKYKYNSENTDAALKEFAFGQLIIYGGALHFSKNCLENDSIMQAPLVSSIYSSLNSEELMLEGDIKGKRVDDGNIDYVIDSILTVCPEVSPEHLAIISRY